MSQCTIAFVTIANLALLIQRDKMVLNPIGDISAMIRTLTKLGEDYALVIDQAILDLLHIDSDTPLSLSTDGRNLLIVPEGTNEEIGDEQFNDILHTVNQRYAQVFRRLAQ